MRKSIKIQCNRCVCLMSILAASAVAQQAIAVPYASGVERVGDTVSFTLNEPADTVTITRNYNETFLVLNDVSAGAHTFDLNGSDNYTISVTHSVPVGWTESVSSIGNAMLGFERANGVAVNTNTGSPNFGRFYVSQRDGMTSYAGRHMGDGIYVFNADATDTFGITDPNDTSAARTAGLDFSGSDCSPFRLSVGSDDSLYISDASDIHGGIYYTDADVSTGGNLLAGLGGVQPITGQNHGSIISTPLTSGSLAGGDLVLYTIDCDLPGSVPDTGSHVWRYDIGGTADYAGAGVLALDASMAGTNSDGSNILSDTIISPDINTHFSIHDTDITRDPRSGNYFINQLGTGLVIMDPSLTNVLFTSKQFQIDNATEYDIFSRVVSMQISPDGRQLAFRNRTNYEIFIVALNEDGLPVLDATEIPGLGVEHFPGPGAFSLFPRAPLTYDLAGNLYAAGNSRITGERLGIYGPGGDSAAITRSDGTFTINGTTYGDAFLAGDLNGDGFVGIEDLSIVLCNWDKTVANGVFTLGDPTGDGFVGIEDLNVVLGNWNDGTPPNAPANIPEPGALALLGLGGIALTRYRVCYK